MSLFHFHCRRISTGYRIPARNVFFSFSISIHHSNVLWLTLFLMRNKIFLHTNVYFHCFCGTFFVIMASGQSDSWQLYSCVCWMCVKSELIIYMVMLIGKFWKFRNIFSSVISAWSCVNVGGSTSHGPVSRVNPSQYLTWFLSIHLNTMSPDSHTSRCLQTPADNLSPSFSVLAARIWV